VLSVLRVASSSSHRLARSGYRPPDASSLAPARPAAQLRRFRLNAFDFIQRFQGLGQVLLNQLVLRRQFFLLIQRIELILNLRSVRESARA
jgi:hypothetical protein